MFLTEIYQSRSKVVYHGAMQDFDKFDLSRIGENADKGGWGIYLSESEEVAKQYTPEGNPIIKKIVLPSGRYFDLDGSLDESLFNDLMESLEYFDESVYNKAQSLRDEVESYGFYEMNLTGFNFYDILSYDFGSKKKMSLFLKDYGLLGNTFMDKTQPSIRNYVLFSADRLRSA